MYLSVFSIDWAEAVPFLDRSIGEVAHFIMRNSPKKSFTGWGNWLDEQFYIQPGEAIWQNLAKSEKLRLDGDGLSIHPRLQIPAIDFIRSRGPYRLLFLIEDLAKCQDVPWVHLLIPKARKWWIDCLMESSLVRYQFNRDELDQIERIFRKLCRGYGSRSAGVAQNNYSVTTDAPIQFNNPDLSVGWLDKGESELLSTFVGVVLDLRPKVVFDCPAKLASDPDNRDWDGWNAWVYEMLEPIRDQVTLAYKNTNILSFCG